MKICLISFDFWNYDYHIVKKLLQKGIEAHHINVGAFSHRNLKERLINTFSKVVLQKNLKHEKRQEFIRKSLEKLGHQDQILILNPDTLDKETIAFARQYTDRLITYLYDNIERCPVDGKLDLFDKIFSFDNKDVAKFGFEKLTNYNYLEYLPQEKQNPKLDLFYITSFDKNRNIILLPLAKQLDTLSLKFQIYVVGKKTWKYKIKYIFIPNLQNISVKFRRKVIPNKIINNYYKNSKAILDLMRVGQIGLSFRIFEAMAMEKKIVTNNPEIRNYNFYNPENILILEDDFSNLNRHFFETPYKKLPKDIYDYYTLESWIDRVFNIAK